MIKTKRLRLIGRQMAFMSVLLVGCGPSDSAKQKLMNAAKDSSQIPSWEGTKQSETGMPDITPETYLAAGQMHETQGRLTRAAAQYRMAIQLYPQHVEAHNRLGLVLCQMQQFNEADAELANAVKLAPDKPHLHNNLGFSYLVQMRWTEAEQSFRKAIELQPGFARAHVNLGMALAQQGRFDEAMKHFLTVVPMEDAWFNIGLMYQSKSRPAEAARAFKTALKLNAAMVAAQQCLDKLPRDISSGAQPFENLMALAPPPVPAPAQPEQPQPPVEAVAVVATRPETSGQPSAFEPNYEDIRTVESPDPIVVEPAESESEPLGMAETPQAGPSTPVQESSAIEEWPERELIAGIFRAMTETPTAQEEEEQSIQAGPFDPETLAALMGTEAFEVSDGLPEVDLFAEPAQTESDAIGPADQTPSLAERTPMTGPPIASTASQPSYTTYDFVDDEGPKDLFTMDWMPGDPAEDDPFEIVLPFRPPMPPAARNALLISTQPSSDAPTPEELRTVIEALMDLSHSPTGAMPKPYSTPATRPAAAAPQSQPADGQTRAPAQLNMSVEMRVQEPNAGWRRPLWDDLEAFGPDDPSDSTTSDD